MRREKIVDRGNGDWEGFPVYEWLGSGFRGQAGWQGIGGGTPGETVIPVVLWSDVVDRIYDDAQWDKVSYQEKQVAVEEWAAEHGAIVISAGKEDYGWMSRAYEEAVKVGAEAVVFEGLS